MRCSIVNLSQIQSQINVRLDAEYWHPEAIEFAKTIGKNMTLESCIEKGYRVVYENTEILRTAEAQQLNLPKFIQAADINSPMINIENAGYVREEDWENYPKGRIQKGEILLEVKGDVKKVAIVPDDFPDRVLVSGTLYKFSVNEKVNKYYLAIFLSCSYGQKLKERLVSNIATPFISRSELYTIPVPCLDNRIQSEIEKVYLRAFDKQRTSLHIYAEAREFLLSELGLARWQPKHRLAFVTNFANAQHTNRLDADYFQPKYDAMVELIKKCPGGWDTLENLVSIMKCVEVGREEYRADGILFIRVSNISPFEITEGKYISHALYKSLIRHQPEQGEILLSKDATPGIAYHLRDKPPRMIPSGGILRLKSKTDEIENDYLALVLNSIPTREQVNRDVGGSLILHWRPDQVRTTIIPTLPKEKQINIRNKIAASFELRKQSNYLLNCAKRAVEIAIDQDEQTAIEWLEHTTTAFNN